jgi:hypothetical protein
VEVIEVVIIIRKQVEERPQSMIMEVMVVIRALLRYMLGMVYMAQEAAVLYLLLVKLAD